MLIVGLRFSSVWWQYHISLTTSKKIMHRIPHGGYVISSNNLQQSYDFLFYRILKHMLVSNHSIIDCNNSQPPLLSAVR